MHNPTLAAYGVCMYCTSIPLEPARTAHGEHTHETATTGLRGKGKDRGRVGARAGAVGEWDVVQTATVM